MVYVHLNRLIQDSDANILLVVGPGRGAPRRSWPISSSKARSASNYPQLERDELGLGRTGPAVRLARRLWPDHLTPETPGMIQQGNADRIEPGPRRRRGL